MRAAAWTTTSGRALGDRLLGDAVLGEVAVGPAERVDLVGSVAVTKLVLKGATDEAGSAL